MPVSIPVRLKNYSFRNPFFVSPERYYEIKTALEKINPEQLIPSLTLKKVFPSSFYLLSILLLLIIAAPLIIIYLNSRIDPLISHEVDDSIISVAAIFLIIIVVVGFGDLILGNYRTTWHVIISYFHLKKDMKKFYLRTFDSIKNTPGYMEFYNSLNDCNLYPETKNPNLKCDFNRLFEEQFTRLGFNLTPLETQKWFPNC